MGDYGLAKSLAERGLALCRETGDKHGTSIALCTLAGVAQAERDYERARDLFDEGLAVSAESGHEADIVHCLEGLASIAGAEGRIARAARLWGAAEALLKEIEAVYTYVPDRSLHRNQVTARSLTIGVRVRAEGGIGKINAEGLDKEGDSYVNDAYGNSEVTVNVEVQGGVGEINLEVV